MCIVGVGVVVLLDEFVIRMEVVVAGVFNSVVDGVCGVCCAFQMHL